MKVLFLFFTLFLSIEGFAVVRIADTENAIFLHLKSCNSKDTILVRKGKYFVTDLEVRKSIVLLGEKGAVLDGAMKGEILRIQCDSVIISSITLQNSGRSSIYDWAALKVIQSKGVVVENVTVYNAFFGIYFQNAAGCKAKNNTLQTKPLNEQENGNGIHCWKCDQMIIEGNQIQGHRDGIYFEFVSNSVIWRNISTGNIRYGLHFMFSNSDSYCSNWFSENGAGVAVMFSKKVKMFGNHFVHNWGDASYGLLLKEISDSYIEGNYFTKNTVGILLEGASRMKVLRNSFDGNGWAMRIQASSMDVEVRSNDFFCNTFEIVSNGELSMNVLDGNFWDAYEGYDLNKDKIGDVPYRPISIFSMIAEKQPPVMLFFHSMIADLIDRSERVLPSLVPETILDRSPSMKPLNQRYDSN